MKTGIRIIIVNIFLTVFMIQLLQAQSKMQGTVVNGSGQPLPNVNVLLLKSTDSALVKGIVSGNTGYYLFTDIPAGKYLLSFTFTGFKQFYTSPYSISSNQDDILVGETRLKEDDIHLTNVTVTAKKPLFEQKTDRLVINVRNSITSAGSTALDVLERSPGVVVDRQNNALSMGGKDGVVVMINGKENHMPVSAIVQMLAGMSSGNIERIELITTPPANFSAEGNAGIINIVLIENNNFGTNGSYSLTIGAGKNKMSSGTLNFNHRKGRINLYGDCSFTISDMNQDLNVYRKIDFAGKIAETYGVNDRDAGIKNFAGRMGIDVQFSKKTTAGAIVSGYNNKWSMDAINQISMLTDQQLDTFIYARNNEINQWKSWSVNLNAQHVFKNGGKFSVNFDRLYYHDNNPNYYLNKYFNGSHNFLYDQEVKSEKITPMTFWIGSGDYTGKWGKNMEWQTGIKFTSSGFTNDILITSLLQNAWITDDNLSAKYELKENISAAYLIFTSTLDPKTTMKFGLRYEYTNSNLSTKDIKNIVDRHYGKLFPNFSISRKINDNANINFSYGRRITRPGFNELAPFTIFFDPNNLITGNPALQASIADAVNTSYSFRNYIFSLSYSYEAGAIARFQSQIDPATNKQFTSPENLISLKTLALTFSVPLRLTSWWNIQNNVIGRWQQANGIYKSVFMQLEQKNFRITSTQSFKLPKNLSIDLSGFYQSADLIGRTIRQPFGSLDFGIQKKIKDNKGNLSFTITDIFNSTKGRSYINLPAQNLVMRRNLQLTQRIFKLTYSHSFGNSKLEAKKNRIDSSEEERKRVE